jgi:DNA-binding MarR family transcriptional regulator
MPPLSNVSRRTDAPDHVGILLWEAATAWKRRFTREMVAAGHPWFAEARGALLRHIGRDGASQGTIAARAGLTKQAVQQHVDALVADGVALRADDPADARRRIVRLTAAGRAALDEGDRIKARLEADLARRLGDERLAALRAMLEEVAAGD